MNSNICSQSNKCCETYQRLVCEFKTNYIYREETEEAIIKLVLNFAEKYFFPRYWATVLDNYRDEIDPQKSETYFEQATFHMAFGYLYPYYTIRFKFFMRCSFFFVSDLRRIFDNDLEYYIYPHGELENYLKILERISTAPFNKALLEKYEKAKKMYQRIMEVNDNHEEWFQRIQEWNDADFISHSIEQRISNNFCNKELWKIYIEYLRPRNLKAMLGVYSRYCGYFLDDLEMKKEFLNEAAKLDIIPNENLLDFHEFRSINTRKIVSNRKEQILHFNLDTAVHQYFAFPNPIVNYIMKQHHILHKLFSTCKYFFKRQPTPMCHRLVIAKNRWSNKNIGFKNSINIENQALTITNLTPELKKFKNLFVTHYLQIKELNDSSLISEILPCIYKFAVKYLKIENQEQISIKDFLFMTESKTVESLELYKVKIFAENGTLAQLEDIMETLPNAYNINMRRQLDAPFYDNAIGFYDNAVGVNLKSFEKMLAFPRYKLFDTFFIGLLHEIFDPSSFVQYLMKNMNQNSVFSAKLHIVDESLLQQFADKVSKHFESFQGNDDKKFGVGVNNFCFRKRY